jgi:hypothetical protein
MIATEPKTGMHVLLLCRDVQFLGITTSVVQQLGGTFRSVDECGQALTAIEANKYDVIVVDWREIDDLAGFLFAVRHSALNHDCVLAAIVRDVLDVRQAFTAGVHFLIHKPAAAVQIERCLRTAHLASLARRRKKHREPVELPASLGTRDGLRFSATILNLAEGGAGLRIAGAHTLKPRGAALADELREEDRALVVGNSISLTFALPGSPGSMRVIGRVVWWTPEGTAGIQFTSIADRDRQELEIWLTRCLERSVAELRQQLAAACA